MVYDLLLHELLLGILLRQGTDGLRHSIAVHLLEAGQGIEYVADHLGHKNIQNTRIYAQITTALR
jgi:site-specific recombinase XerD